MLNALAATLNSGLIRVYGGTEPANANAALSSNPQLAELTFGATAFGTPTQVSNDMVITANAITQDSSADLDGIATFFRAHNTAGTTTVYQGTVGTSGQQLNLTATNIVQGGVVSVTSLTISLPLA